MSAKGKPSGWTEVGKPQTEKSGEKKIKRVRQEKEFVNIAHTAATAAVWKTAAINETCKTYPL